MIERQRPLGNVAVLAQHSTIRNAVMGEEACTRKVPTDQQLARMRAAGEEAMDAGAAGFASSFSPNHSGWGGRPMPSTIATDEELRALTGVLGEKQRGIFVMATGPRATPPFMESIAADTGRPAFIVTVLAMYNRAQPERALHMYEQCAQALARGREVYIHANCQPLSFDFTLGEPYPMYSHDAFDAVRALPSGKRCSAIAAPVPPAAARQLRASEAGHPLLRRLEPGRARRRAGTELARREGKDPLDYVFDLPLDVQLVGKLYQNDDAGVAPLLKHPAGVIALSDAGAHLIYFCDAGYGFTSSRTGCASWARSRWRRACAA